jgi:spore coat protein U-like protein
MKPFQRTARVFLLAVLMFAVLLSRSAYAQSCSASASAIDFGSVNPIALSSVAATGTVNVTCTWPVVSLTPNALVCLNLAVASPRFMANGANRMQHDLYQDAGHTLIWGANSLGTTPIFLTLVKPALGTSTNASVTIYGQIAANQPTVPSVGNANTVYIQSFSSAQTSLNVGFYTLTAPTCASLTSSSGTFAFTVSATVINNCTISVGNISFSTSGLLSAALTANGSITTRCTNGNAYQIALNKGLNGTVAARKMLSSGGAMVGYQLYIDAARTLLWGDGTLGTSMAGGTGTGNVLTTTIYGVVPVQATPAPGNYSDTVTATISF